MIDPLDARANRAATGRACSARVEPSNGTRICLNIAVLPFRNVGDGLLRWERFVAVICWCPSSFVQSKHMPLPSQTYHNNDLYSHVQVTARLRSFGQE